MQDWEFGNFSKRCCVSGRELQGGELCYSAIVQLGATLERRDYSAEEWRGPPEQCLAWWSAPALDAKQGPRVHWAPHEVLRQFFEDLQTESDQDDLRYMAALLLLRRKTLRPLIAKKREKGVKSPRKTTPQTAHTMDQEVKAFDVLRLVCPRTEREYEIPIVEPATPERAAEIERRLGQLLEVESTGQSHTKSGQTGAE